MYPLVLSESSIDQIVDSLRIWKVIAIPTETVYWLACDASNDIAVRKLFDLKQRSLDKAIGMLVADVSMIEASCKTISPFEHAVIQKYMPWALTLVLPKKDHISLLMTGGKDSVWVRMPDYPLLQQAIAQFGWPIAATSANISTQPSPTSIEQVFDYFPWNVDLYIDGGVCSIWVASTVIEIQSDNNNPIVHVHRQWSISRADIQSFLHINGV